ncbi:MAG TPA: hypothetical protein VM030_05590 [Acidimicrobiales bacterium]|nr:hypothetical protein [Acidimicrobiales bacterium]
MTSTWVGDGVVATAWAAVLSGAPSTAVSMARGENLLDSSAAAGTLLVPISSPRALRLAAGGIAHGAISLWWGLVLSRALPRRRTVLWGAVAGLAIAALDLGVIGRRFPAIRDLDPGPQVADHLAFGIVTAAAVRRSRESRRPRRGR